MSNSRTLLVLALASLSATLSAASEWRPFGLQGTIIRSLAATPELLCAGTEGQGMHCLDLGAPAPAWTANGLPGQTVVWLWIDAADPDVRFAVVTGFPPSAAR